MQIHILGDFKFSSSTLQHIYSNASAVGTKQLENNHTIHMEEHSEGFNFSALVPYDAF